MISKSESILLNLIRNSKYFDAEWYLRRYPDVKLLEMDPALHFVRYGGILKRAPNPDFDVQFYFETYRNLDSVSENTFPGHALFEASHSLVASEQQLKELVASEKAESIKAFPPIEGNPSIRKKISYCVPVLGRLNDLKGTLHFNLQENDLFRNKIEFLVIDFGKSSEIHDWISENFPEELSTGYLRLIKEPNLLDTWHFSKAKNAFRFHMRGDVYSSLDADNFVTSEDTQLLLDTASRHPYGFLYHHFSGNWGDGTSGRVSIPDWVYRRVGYDDRLLPRQFDELDLILGVLKRYPTIPFIGTSEERNALTMSLFCKGFHEDEKLPNRIYFQESCRSMPPLNPRGSDYTDQLPHWRAMNNFNGAFSALTHGTNPDARKKNTNNLNKYKLELLECLPKKSILDILFHLNQADRGVEIDQNDICLFTCVKNEESYLPKFIEHYRKMGVSKFFIVDDHSRMPVSDLDLGADVTILKPKVGRFGTSKTLWLEGLIKAYVPEGAWVMTVDADEFVQLPRPFNNLTELVKDLEVAQRDYSVGLLLDMVPAAARFSDQSLCDPKLFDTNFDHFYSSSSAPSITYNENPSIKWAFGSHAGLSWRYDVRYHAFGTFDSLRKFPLFRYRQNRHLNQGFHTFHHLDGTSPPGPEVWSQNPILPIFHYKLVKLFSEYSRRDLLSAAHGYHSRTKENIKRIFGTDPGDTVKELRRLSPDFVPASRVLDSIVSRH